MNKSRNKNFFSIAALSVSVLAVILSQFRPLYEYFDKAELEVIIETPLHISHDWGNLFLTQFIQIENSGKASGSIKKSVIYLEKNGSKEFKKVIPGQYYISETLTASSYQMPNKKPFRNISIRPGGIWESRVAFYQRLKKDKRDKITRFSNKISGQLKSIFDIPLVISEIGDTLYQDISHFMEYNLNGFNPGEYYLIFIFWDDDSKDPIKIKGYSFFVSQSDIEILKKKIEVYKIGEGIVKPKTQHLGFEPNLIEITDHKTLNTLLKNFNKQNHSLIKQGVTP